jgi:hypothetical protein
MSGSVGELCNKLANHTRSFHAAACDQNECIATAWKLAAYSHPFMPLIGNLPFMQQAQQHLLQVFMH